MTDKIKSLEEFVSQVVSIMYLTQSTQYPSEIRLTSYDETTTLEARTAEKTTDYFLTYSASIPKEVGSKPDKDMVETNVIYQESFTDPSEGPNIVKKRFGDLQTLLTTSLAKTFPKDNMAIRKNWGYNLEIYDAGQIRQEHSKIMEG